MGRCCHILGLCKARHSAERQVYDSQRRHLGKSYCHDQPVSDPPRTYGARDLCHPRPGVAGRGGAPRKFLETEKCRNLKVPKSFGSKIVAAWREARILAAAQTTFNPNIDADKTYKQWPGKEWDSWGVWYNYKVAISDKLLRSCLSQVEPGTYCSGNQRLWYSRFLPFIIHSRLTPIGN